MMQRRLSLDRKTVKVGEVANGDECAAKLYEDSEQQRSRVVCRLHHTELQEMDDAEDRLDRTIELSMVEQCMNIVKTGLVQRHQVKYGFPRIHGFVYNLLDGELKELDVDL
ncbi:hypothetical protein Poli38472_014580 [Pythium oligandrum]|uniref:Carbonic anhydrase n=1 Tax=Pythium oligandrum TaxID=41045 RepID=A0A8K1CP02_PYTOL|nr:hypothetical protein Poli38472_014580 [Pythium oligandrum]|eukprot:TMW66604.1 hypothetical protein Poli38472_014580 [Pythium oligandrum]